MPLLSTCTTKPEMEELLKSIVAGRHNLAMTIGDYAIKVIIKTKDHSPEGCGNSPSLWERLRSAISVEDCGTIGLNVVFVDRCNCLSCGEELPCNTGDQTFEDLLLQAFVYTTDGQWALQVLNVTE